MSLYSPLDIHLYDKQGNHTGPIIDENGNKVIEENIPNSYYDIIGEHKFVGWGISSNVKVNLEGYDKGSYTIELKEISATEEGEKTDTHLTMKNLPTSENTKVTFTIPQTGLTNISNLTADYDGDGNTDYTITPKINGEVTLSEGESTKNTSNDKDSDDDEDDDKKEDVKNSNNVIINDEKVQSSESEGRTLENKELNNETNNKLQKDKKDNSITKQEIKNDNANTNQNNDISKYILIIISLFLIFVSIFIIKRKLIK